MTPHVEHGHLRIDVDETTNMVIIAIEEPTEYGGFSVTAIQLPAESARALAQYILEFVV